MTTLDAEPLGKRPGDGAREGRDSAGLIAMLHQDLANGSALLDLCWPMLFEHDLSALYSRIVTAASELLESDFATLQLLQASEGGQLKLELVAHRGFTGSAIEHWHHLQADSKRCCVVAWLRRSRMIMPDVQAHFGATDIAHLEPYLETGIRAVQSTPLCSRDGTLIGVLSTHWSRVHEPDEQQLRLLDLLARQACGLIERTREETLLRESEARLQQMGCKRDQFLATLAHELRNPLSAIRSGLQILRRGDSPSAAAGIVEMLDRQLQHTTRLIDDLTDVARIDRGAFSLYRRPTDLSAVLETALEQSRPAIAKAGHRLKVCPAQSPLSVNGDEVRLTEVLSNLVNNAAKYTPPGGEIEIALMREGQRAVVEVRDNGIGFSADAQSLLFTPFGRLQPQAHAEGLGIGLALAKKLVELHGGTISARSDGPNKGSCFTVSLPLDDGTTEVPIGGLE